MDINSSHHILYKPGSSPWRTCHLSYISVSLSIITISKVGGEFLVNAPSAYRSVLNYIHIVYSRPQLAVTLLVSELVSASESHSDRLLSVLLCVCAIIFVLSQKLTSLLDVRTLLLYNTRMWRPQWCRNEQGNG